MYTRELIICLSVIRQSLRVGLLTGEFFLLMVYLFDCMPSVHFLFSTNQYPFKINPFNVNGVDHYVPTKYC